MILQLLGIFSTASHSYVPRARFCHLPLHTNPRVMVSQDPRIQFGGPDFGVHVSGYKFSLFVKDITLYFEK